VFAIVARGSDVDRRASGGMGHLRERERFESRVQAPEIIEIVEDRPGDLIRHGIGHARGRDDHGADAEGVHIRRVGRIGAAGNRRALVILVFGHHPVDSRAADGDEHAAAGECHIANQAIRMADRVDDRVELIGAKSPVLLRGGEFAHLREIVPRQAESGHGALHISPLPRSGTADADAFAAQIRHRADSRSLVSDEREYIGMTGEQDAQVGRGTPRGERSLAGRGVGEHVRRDDADIDAAATERFDVCDEARRGLFGASQIVARRVEVEQPANRAAERVVDVGRPGRADHHVRPPRQLRAPRRGDGQSYETACHDHRARPGPGSRDPPMSRGHIRWSVPSVQSGL